jgi:hypothetical protein
VIRRYADCIAVLCDKCGKELRVTSNLTDDLRAWEAFCPGCEPGCADCGCSLANRTRHPAPDITPDGQETWLRCDGCHRDHEREDRDTIPAPPPTTRDRSLEAS